MHVGIFKDIPKDISTYSICYKTTSVDAVSTTFQRKAPDFRGFFRFSPNKTTSPIFAQLRTLCLDKTDRPVGWHSLSPAVTRRHNRQSGCRITGNGVCVVMAYETIDGQKYEKELLDLARKHTTGRGEGKLSKDEVADLFKSAQDGPGVTDTEKATLAYIRKNFEFTDAAAKDFDAAFGKL